MGGVDFEAISKSKKTEREREKIKGPRPYVSSEMNFAYVHFVVGKKKIHLKFLEDDEIEFFIFSDLKMWI